MTLALIRHAQTPANIARVWHGHTDTPLSDKGHQQIELLGQHFHKVMTPDVIYASPLQRARLTAEAVGKHFDLEVISDERLMEFGMGEWEGESFERLSGELNFMPQLLKDEHHSAPGGESRHQVQARVTEAVEEIADRHHGEKVVIVSHGVALSLALGQWFADRNREWTKFHKDNTAVTQMTFEPLKLIQFNNVDHLEK